MYSENLVVLALGASRAFGENICGHLDIMLSALEEREFEDGEHKTRPLVSVRGKDVFVVHSLYGDEQQSVNDKLCRPLALPPSRSICAMRARIAEASRATQ